MTGKYNYWIDLCTVEEDTLKIWGWAYVVGKNSANSKFKLMLESASEEYIFGITVRKREDIQKNFGNEKDNYFFQV